VFAPQHSCLNRAAVALFCLLTASLATRPQEAKAPAPKYLRQFSSADDVTHEAHPVLNKTLDIVAGPGETHPSIDRLAGPYGVTTDRAGRVLVADPEAGALHIFDFAEAKYFALGGRSSHLKSPTNVAVDHDGNIYVSDPVVVAVVVYDARGKFLHYLGKLAGAESYFQSPAGIAIHEPPGHIYVCDSRRHMVLTLDKKGHILNHIGKRWGGKGPGEFRYPSQIAIAGDELVVLDRANSRLQILDLGGHFRREIKLPEVSADAGLALDASKNIYVSDPQFSAINVFAYDGHLLYKFGRNGSKPGEFDEPSGLWIDAGQTLYVADTKNKRVQEFQLGTR
jgi:DNA-binding beta-propeller fold protein YncE